jgi:hypothetical protein
MTRNGEAGPKAGPDAATSTVGATVNRDNPTITVPLDSLDRVAVLLGFAYEATWTAADAGGPADWSTQGDPLAQALGIVRELMP